MGNVADEYARGGDLVEYICGQLDQLPEANQHAVVQHLEDRYYTGRYRGHSMNVPSRPTVSLDDL